MDLFKVSRRIIKILLSVSFLSMLFSSLPLLFQFLNQFSINKSYVFLFCNGLMVFIAKNSDLPSDHPPSDQFKDLDVAAAPFNSQEHDMVADSPEQQQEEEEEKRMIVAADSHEEEDKVADTEKEWVDETEIEDGITDTEKKWVDDREREDEVADTETKEEEEHEEVEELNKKCEDFIRKMKAAFCSEPRHDYGYYSDFDHHTAMVTVR